MKKVWIGIAAMALMALANAPALLARYMAHSPAVAVTSTTHAFTSKTLEGTRD